MVSISWFKAGCRPIEGNGGTIVAKSEVPSRTLFFRFDSKVEEDVDGPDFSSPLDFLYKKRKVYRSDVLILIELNFK